MMYQIIYVCLIPCNANKVFHSALNNIVKTIITWCLYHVKTQFATYSLSLLYGPFC